MRLVEAVRDLGEITVIERKFRLNGWELTADLWRMGVNLALRISDLLSLRYDQLQGEFIYIKEGKTGKYRRIKINNVARSIIHRRQRENPGHVYLFQATGNRVKNRPPKPVSRQFIALHFKQVGHELGLRLGTHSMRKTRGWAMYRAGRSAEEISKVLNHSSPAVTMRYIGIIQADIDQSYDDFEL